jgi:CrcB protein
VKPFVATGILGGFTTWSHFVVEADQLAGAGQAVMAFAYVVASIVAGVVAVAAGAAVAGAATRPRVRGTG